MHLTGHAIVACPVRLVDPCMFNVQAKPTACRGRVLVYNVSMTRQPIAQIESYLEHVIEGAFASLFARRVSIRDLAIKLARAMVDHLRHDSEVSSRPLAPDAYVIHLRPDVYAQLVTSEPQVTVVLCQHLQQVAEHFGYHLAYPPSVKLVTGKDLQPGQLKVTATYTALRRSSTAALTRVEPFVPQGSKKSAQLLIAEIQSVPLDSDLVNIGRDPSNHIVLDDPYVSRHHVQLRWRGEAYLIFDVNSQAGTYVNGARIRDHRLQSGDVIDIGKTRLLYLEEPPDHDQDTGSTQTLDPDSF